MGIKISFSMTNSYLLDGNIIALVNKMQSQFDKWSQLPLSWAGHIAVVKVKILPNVLGFFFQNLIDCYHTSYFLK